MLASFFMKTTNNSISVRKGLRHLIARFLYFFTLVCVTDFGFCKLLYCKMRCNRGIELGVRYS